MNLDGSKTPEWFPNTNIYLDYKLYGFDGMIGSIKLRAQERGSEIRTITAIDRANILQIKRKYENRKKKFLESEEGVKEALREVKSLFEEIERICDEISSSSVKLQYKKKNDYTYYLSGVRHDDEKGNYSFEIIVQWYLKYRDTLNESMLIIEKVNIGRKIKNRLIDGYETPKEELIYNFDVTPSMKNCWRDKQNNKLLTSSKLADDIVKIIIAFMSS